MLFYSRTEFLILLIEKIENMGTDRLGCFQVKQLLFENSMLDLLQMLIFRFLESLW